MPSALPGLVVLLDGTRHLLPADAAPLTIGADPLCDIVRPGGPARLAEVQVRDGRWQLVVPAAVGSVAVDGRPARSAGDAWLIPVDRPVRAEVRAGDESVTLRMEPQEIPVQDGEQAAAVVDVTGEKVSRRDIPDEFAASWPLPDGQALTIGRAGGTADVQVPGMELALTDTVVRRSGDTLHVKWAGRGVGLSVGGRRVRRATLPRGQRFRLGHHRFWFTGDELAWERTDDPDYLHLHGFTVTHHGTKVPTTQDVTLDLPTGAFLAVLGPSGVGKSSVMAALLGESQSEGVAILGPEPLGGGRMPDPSLVSFVPQAGEAPREMTVWQVLDITARMRLARDLSRAERRERIETTLDRLGLAAHAKQRVRNLSGGQRRRLSVAMELITEPNLLILDEPTSGLDDGLDRTLMQDLRRVADSGTTVVVITHSLSHLRYATHVLALTGREPEPGEQRAASQVGYFGPPETLLESFGATDPADVFDRLREGRQVQSPLDLDPRTARPSADPEHSTRARKNRQNLSLWRSFFVSLRRERLRQRLNFAQVFWMSVIAPALVGLIAVAVSPNGLSGTSAAKNADLPTILSVVAISLSFLAMALSLTSVVTDLPILVRERRWGVRSSGVIAAKAAVRVIPALVQAAVVVAVLWFLRPRPEQTLADVPALLGLYAPLALLTISCMCIGLLVSTLAGTAERAVGAMSALLAVMVILCGLVIPLGDARGMREILGWISYATPTRWSVASLGSFLDLQFLTYMVPDSMWDQDLRHFLIPLGCWRGSRRSPCSWRRPGSGRS